MSVARKVRGPAKSSESIGETKTAWPRPKKTKKARRANLRALIWLRGQDLNLRPSGYEPDELPGCSTPRHTFAEGKMSLTYALVPPNERAACAARNPVWRACRKEKISTCALQTWQRPTLPRLETKYHQRWGVSRPCSEWERVQPPRHNHQVGKEHVVSRSCVLSCHPIATRRVRWAQGMRTIKPIELLVPVNFMRCRTSIPGLSTWSSSTALREYSF